MQLQLSVMRVCLDGVCGSCQLAELQTNTTGWTKPLNVYPTSALLSPDLSAHLQSHLLQWDNCALSSFSHSHSFAFSFALRGFCFHFKVSKQKRYQTCPPIFLYLLLPLLSLCPTWSLVLSPPSVSFFWSSFPLSHPLHPPLPSPLWWDTDVQLLWTTSAPQNLPS